MEVHHPHHPTHKKKWNEYLLEFFMLFFAVSLGFFAENLREHFVEKERAHEMIAQFKSDIRNNIHLMDSVANRDKSIIQKLDSALLYLAFNDTIDADSLFNNLPGQMHRYLSKNDTYDQMKSSGSLRYIKDTVLLKLILDYASECNAAETRSTISEGEFVMSRYGNTLDQWRPKAISIKRFTQERISGTDSIINKEKLSQTLTSPETLKIIASLKKYQGSTTYSGKQAEDLKTALIPNITRRSALLTNTVRFMGRAKKTGEALLDYLEKTEH